MLVAWGHFARTLEFTKRLAGIPIDQKAVVRAPHEKLAEFAIGLLSGIEYLSDLSEGPAPLARDDEVAQAWQLQPRRAPNLACSEHLNCNQHNYTK